MTATSKQRNYLWASFTSLIMIGIVKHFWPDLIPFGFWDLWKAPHGVWAGVLAGWPILAWGGFHFLRTWIFVDENHYALAYANAWDTFVNGLKISAWAGITEEIAFRWLIFLGAMPSLVLGNFLFFGCLGFGFAEWFHLHVWGALANWTTFGILEPQIFDPRMWYVGAALLYSNAFFREGHAYQGIIGIINSWFLGMGFFYLTFNYGLGSAIIVHFLYDVLIFSGMAAAIAKRS